MATSAFDLSTLDGSNGFVLNGIQSNDRSGRSVSSAGDVNGDGFDDIVIGAADGGFFDTGESYVVFGAATGFAASLELSALDGSDGFTINGVDETGGLGRSVSNAGDVNGDGLDDLIIGAFGVDSNGNRDAGESYVVFGNTAGFTASLDLSDLDGSNGFAINGASEGDFSGNSVSNAGDVNGDGLDDIIIGAFSANDNGNSYVVFGNTAEFTASLDLSALDGSNGFALNGIDSDDRSGFSVSNAGDVNSDGIDDIIIGANGADPNGNSYAGESYVVFGDATGFAASLELSDLDGSDGFILSGIDSDDGLGRSVSNAGDVNGDGISDIIIGAGQADGNTGESYVVFGSASGFDASLDLSTLDGGNGFVISGVDEGDFSGNSVSSAGDVNGDGIDDLIIGSFGADLNGNGYTGESYVVFGDATGFDASLELSTLDGSDGLTLNGIDGNDRAGFAVSGAGDVNGDGIGDIIIGAGGGGIFSSGESYVVFGSADIGDGSVEGVEIDGDEGNDYIRGGEGDDTLRGFGGNDTILGNAGDDTIDGGEGNDRSLGGNGDDIVDGENGNDTILGNAGNDTLNGGEGNDRVLGGEGDDTIDGGGGNDTIDGGNGNDLLSGDAGNDRVSGGEGDDTVKGGAGNDVVRGQLGNDRIFGADASAAAPGSSEQDTLLGGLGSDLFVLGDVSNVFYLGSGSSDFAKVRDFSAADNDLIQLSGSSSDYSLKVSGGGTQIFADDGVTTDLVGVVKGASFADFSSGFTFV